MVFNYSGIQKAITYCVKSITVRIIKEIPHFLSV